MVFCIGDTYSYSKFIFIFKYTWTMDDQLMSMCRVARYFFASFLLLLKL